MHPGSMGRLEFTTPRAAWGGEATDFTPLLSQPDMLAYLGEETGIGPLALVETEHATAGNRSLDILAETADGRKVAIENQYGVADHDHLTRGLAYAVATGATVLVLVAEGHRDEFLSVADYLNEVGQLSDEGVLVWLVKVRAVRRTGDSIWSPEFVVMAEPNEWEGEIRRTTTPALTSLEDFYEKCSDVQWAADARAVIEYWGERGLAEAHTSTQTVSLFCPMPGETGRGPNVLQVHLNGDFTISRGYLIGAGNFDDHQIERLDSSIREAFPSARWPDKRFYITARLPSSESMVSFARWLVDDFIQPDPTLT